MKDFKPEIEWVNPESLVPYAKNPKAHSIDQIDQIASSISSFGWHSPIVVNRDNVIISGHGRLEAAIKLGMQQVPIVKMDLDEYQAMAARILDNRSNESPWNLDMLRFDLGTLKNEGIDLKLTGFPEFQIGDFLETGFMSDDVFEPRKLGTEFAEGKGTQGLTDPDEVPENVPAKSKLGDLYRLGNHRLLCGDCLNLNTVQRLMDGQRAKLIATDPPYGINHVEVSQEKGQSKNYRKIANDEKQDEELKDFIYQAITTAIQGALAPGFAFYMWHAMKMQAYFSQAAAAAGILFHRQIIWVKPQFVFGRGHYHWRHELCLMGWLQGNEPEFYGERNQSTIWEIGRENDKIHPTQKPVRISEIPMENHTKSGDVVYEPFAGSGGMFIAAEKLGRHCFGLEIDPHYCDVIVARWEAFTGQKAELLNTA